MNTKKMILVLLMAFGFELTMAQQPDSVRSYIDTALSIMQSRSLFAKKLDWSKVRSTAFELGKSAKTYSQAFPAIAYAFMQLRDDHGMVAGVDTFARYPSHVNFAELLSPMLKKEAAKGPIIVAKMLGDVAYLRVPTMIVNEARAMKLIANRLRDSLCMLAGKQPKGVVIDLRINNGGNSAAMLSGIGPRCSIYRYWAIMSTGMGTW